MNVAQKGIAGMQMIIAVCVVAAVSVIAVPKYAAFVDKSKITEAFNLAGASKRKLAEFYILNNRFPKSAGEAEAMKTGTLSPPKFVDRMEVEPGFKGHEVTIKVYLKDGAAKPEWNFTTPAYCSMPLVHDGRVWVAAAGRGLFGLDLETGSVAWKAELADAALFTPILWDGKPAFWSSDGWLLPADAAR